MRIATISVLIFLAVTTRQALGSDRTDKTIAPKVLTVVPKIDGQIDSVWTTVDSVSDFFQLQPFFDKPPSHKTVVKLFTTTDALYCLMICYDDRAAIQNVTGTLDNASGDVVSIMLDTFGDNRTAYKMAVTASGCRADCRLLDDARNRDYNWDGVWRSASRIYDWGFVVEWEIPYRSLQYGSNMTSWGLDFDRWCPARNEDLYWASYAQNEGQRVSKFGRLQFRDFYPSSKGLNLEVYPVGIAKSTMVGDDTYHNEATAGLDVFYNPSEQLTFQMTVNPDFAQIEADPYSFNISRYETHYNELRPFFTQGNEIFTAEGKQRHSGFYSPLELFYSRRIGRKLPDGSEVPLTLGSKAFGRSGDWEYGGFLALTGEKDYAGFSGPRTEGRAGFSSLRLKKQIFGNSSVGIMYVGKHTGDMDNGVFDIDGAFRTADLQCSYQIARSYRQGDGGYAASLGFVSNTDHWVNLWKLRAVDENFDVNDVGFVPWRGTTQLVGFTGPRWYFESGPVMEFMFGVGPGWNYKAVEAAATRSVLLTVNMQLRSNWGWEFDGQWGKSKDNGVDYWTYDYSLSTWFNISPAWSGDLYGEWANTYNFSRGYVGRYASAGCDFNLHLTSTIQPGTSFNMYLEEKPDNSIEDITYDARPYLNVTPINDLSVRLYSDNLYTRNSDKLQQVISGFLVSYNFMPKSWIYFALNDVRDRSDEFDALGRLRPNRLHVTARAAVFKVKYLYYF